MSTLIEQKLEQAGRFYGKGIPGYEELLARFGSTAELDLTEAKITE